MKDTAKGVILVDYQQIIPLLVQAFKEQQLIIDSLRIVPQEIERRVNSTHYQQSTLDSLRRQITKCKVKLKNVV
ncbi:MAG: hypothetical protein ACO1G9_12710 [Bacteroidota bacterium]